VGHLWTKQRGTGSQPQRRPRTLVVARAAAVVLGDQDGEVVRFQHFPEPTRDQLVPAVGDALVDQRGGLLRCRGFTSASGPFAHLRRPGTGRVGGGVLLDRRLRGPDDRQQPDGGRVARERYCWRLLIAYFQEPRIPPATWDPGGFFVRCYGVSAGPQASSVVLAGPHSFSLHGTISECALPADV
jgi:hypothetical protein